MERKASKSVMNGASHFKHSKLGRYQMGIRITFLSTDFRIVMAIMNLGIADGRQQHSKLAIKIVLS